MVSEVREVRLVVDPVSCTGIGICAHAGGRVVDLDTWGYPIVPASALAGGDARAARAAAKACPRRALFVLPVDGHVDERADRSADRASGDAIDQPGPVRPGATRRSRPAPAR